MKAAVGKNGVQSWVEQAVDLQLCHTEVTCGSMAIGYRHNHSTGCGCSAGSCFAVFQHQHLCGFDLQSGGGCQIDFGVWFSVCDIFGCECKDEAFGQSCALQQPLHVVVW